MSNLRQKNILFFQNSILPANGGVPRVSDIVSKELKNRGYKCYFIYYEVDNIEYPEEIKLKVDIRQPLNRSKRNILEFIAKNNINFFICQNAYSFHFIKVYKQIRLIYPGSPFLCFLHASPDYWQITYKSKLDFSVHKYLFNYIKRTIKKIIFPFYNPYIKTTVALYNLCDNFILLSDSFIDPFIKLYNLDYLNNKLITIPNPSSFSDCITIDEVKKKEKIVLVVSRLDEHQKKISLALKIWKDVLQDQHNDWKLIIVGTGPDEKYYKDYSLKNNLKNVTFTGQKKYVIDYYRKASIYIMTSIWEGLPMALLEAQQNGVVPIVFNNFSAIYDVVTNEKNGYIIEENCTQKFADKLLMLMQNEDLRYKMALDSIEMSKRYHVSNIVTKWEDVLKSLKINFDKGIK